jgi:starvation-inducible DNA-binding protein
MLKPNSGALADVYRAVPAQSNRGTSHAIAAGLDELLVRTITLRDLYRSARGKTEDMQSVGLYLLFEKHYKEQLRLVELVVDRLRSLGKERPDVAGRQRQGAPGSYALGGRILPLLLLLDLLDAHDAVLAAVRTATSSVGCPYSVSSQDPAIAQVVLVNNWQFRLICEQFRARYDRRRAIDANRNGQYARR